MRIGWYLLTRGLATSIRICRLAQVAIVVRRAENTYGSITLSSENWCGVGVLPSNLAHDILIRSIVRIAPYHVDAVIRAVV